MEYIYAAMLLNKAGKEVNEQNLTKVLEAAGIKVDNAKVKSLIAALEGVEIEKVIEENSQVAVAATPVATTSSSGSSENKEEKKEEKKKEESTADAAAGLGSLFG